jgi:N-acetylmuramoyl-L-alanine amidase
MRSIVRIVLSLIVVLTVASGRAAAVDPHRPGAPSVLLDAAYGGADPGPALGGPVPAKQVTLDIATRVARALARAGVTVHPARSGDATVSLDERLAKVLTMGADVYVQVTVSAAAKSCVQVSTPALPAIGEAAGDDTELYMRKLWREDQAARSASMAKTIANNLREKGVPLCGEARAEAGPLGEKLVVPAAVVQWRIGKPSRPGTQAVDSKMRNRVAAGIAAGLRKDLAGTATR